MVAAGAAALVVGITWFFGILPGSLLALMALFGILRFDPTLPHPVASTQAHAIFALLVAAALAPMFARAAWRRDIVEPPANPRQARTPARGSRAVGGDASARRSISLESAEPDGAIDQEIIQRTLREIRDTLGGEEVVLWRYQADSDAIELVCSASSQNPVVEFTTDPPVDSLVHWAVQQRLPASNYETESSLFLTVPVGKEGRFLGAVGMYASERRGIPRDRTRTLLGRMAVRLGMLIDIVSDGQETRRYRGKAETVARNAERIQSHQDLKSLGTAICQSALEVSSGTRAAFVSWDEKSGAGTVHSVSTIHSLPVGFAVTPDSLVGIACREKQRFAIRESYRMSEMPLLGTAEPPRKVGSVVVVPLHRNGRTQGAVVVEGDEAGQLTGVEGELLKLLGSVISVALDNVEHLESVSDRAVRDALTGLPNRRKFEERLAQLLAESDRFGQNVSLILVDIDRFKSVNDTLGHDAGDAVLVNVARVIASSMRNIDLCARYGGEELAILLPQTHLHAASGVAERLRAAVEALETQVGDKVVKVTASFGLAAYPESIASHDGLFSAADKALYRAKDGGRNAVRMALPRQVSREG